MKKYYKRITDETLIKKLKSKGAVLVTGPKWCGKTTSSKQIAKSILYMQDPKNIKQNKDLAELNPAILLKGDTPRLIDEWQISPNLWDAVRFEVDIRDEFGQFILTGSATPVNLSKDSHSGIGRIVRLKMRTMSLYESKDSNGSVSLKDLFENKDILIEGVNDLNIEDLAYLICRGGWPKAIGCDREIALQQAIDYYDGLVNSNISAVDNVNRNPEIAKRLLKSLSRFVSSQAKISKIIDDLKVNETQVISDKTIRTYLNALTNIYVIENSSAWNPNLRSKTAIQTSATRYFSDPSIATAALGINPNDLINDLQTMGLLFENMCVRDLRIYCESIGGQLYHYRDRNQLECDAVIHLNNGAYGLVEIKLGGDKLIEEGVISLNKLDSKIETNKMNHPSFKMILIGVGNYAYRRKDGILVVPIGCLKN